jgi:hypothetical protein
MNFSDTFGVVSETVSSEIEQNPVHEATRLLDELGVRLVNNTTRLLDELVDKAVQSSQLLMDDFFDQLSERIVTPIVLVVCFCAVLISLTCIATRSSRVYPEPPIYCNSL